MKILDLLKKLGVIQGGTSSWKGDAKERPVGFMDEDASTPTPDAPNSPQSSEK